MFPAGCPSVFQYCADRSSVHIELVSDRFLRSPYRLSVLGSYVIFRKDRGIAVLVGNAHVPAVSSPCTVRWCIICTGLHYPACSCNAAVIDICIGYFVVGTVLDTVQLKAAVAVVFLCPSARMIYIEELVLVIISVSYDPVRTASIVLCISCI